MNKKLIRYVLLIVGVSLMSLGISFSIKSDLGTSPISCVPYVLSLAFPLSVGEFTIIFNVFLVLFQMALLKEIKLKQISQIFVCILFGYMTDFNLWILSSMVPSNYLEQWLICILGAFVLAFGLNIEVKSDITMLPGDGCVQAISEVLNKDFGKVKPFFDLSMVIMGIVFAYLFLHRLAGVREGTVFAAIAVGFIIQFYNRIFGYKIDNYLEE
ncbi:DUF6198 family protein [uncultured Methanobrevibacter sp.]|uniref:YczE/YyaS/YitT family protein n=1 Tax=uncultured Methanobrevibacter sp. TaxID=253161 RepID=UPI002625A478